MVRDALIYDDDDTLRLALGARDRWWRGAQVTRAPTRWGAIDLRLGRDGPAASWHWTAVPVWTALTLPRGTVIAEPPALPLIGAAGGTRVLAPPGASAARVSLRPAVSR